MAKFRFVHTHFWEDAKVLEEMTPEDKYFFLYLLTNPKTTQIGVYQITKKQMAFDLGYTTESVKALLDRFTNHHRLVKYNEETREIVIFHWGKYNLNKGGKPILDCVKKELKEVKDKTLLSLIIPTIPNESIKTAFLSHLHDTCHDTSTTRGQKEKEQEKEKEKEKEQQKENAFRFYGDNFGFLTPHLSDKLSAWLDDFDGADEILIKAMEIAIEQNVIKFSYVEGILRGWSKRKVKTLADVQALQMEKQNSNNGADRNVGAESVIQSDSGQTGGYDQFSL